MKRTWGRRRGQVAVETAIVMPLFVFIILGMLQLGLMHQARVLAKYAAYKAVRVGSIHNAKKSAMKRAALAVLLPMTGRRNTPSFFSATPSNFQTSWSTANNMNESGSPEQKLVDITICDPLGNVSGDFDDPAGNMGVTEDWQAFNKGRLSIQVTFYYQLVIPFVNGVIWHMVKGTETAELMRTIRLAPQDDSRYRDWITQRQNGGRRSIDTVASFQNLADRNIYVMPIRASWSMRMQSNFLPSRGSDFTLPGRNLCRIGWRPPGYSAP